MLVQPYNTLNQPNVNVSWMSDWTVWLLYVFSIFGCRYALDLLTFNSIPSDHGWTIIHLTHCVGSAFHTERKDIQKLTLWEQIDGERAFTPTRKFLTIIPILLFLLTWHTNNYNMDWINLLNFVSFGVIIVAKLPIVHGVRFFGINSE